MVAQSRTNADTNPRHRTLTTKEVASFRQMLEDMREQVLKDLRTLAHDHRDRAHAHAFQAPKAFWDAMQAVSDQACMAFALGVVNNRSEALSEIDAALARVEDGTYGICQLTGKRIPLARLLAIPWARCRLEVALRLQTLIEEEGRPPM